MESNFQIGKMDDQTPPEQTQLTARFLVPVMITRKFVITEVKVEDAYCNDMRCDGCGNDMGSQNPKGFLKHLIGGLNYATNVVENRVSLNSLA
jgi:hypothetical protein